jgi:hypothetical protein
MTTLATERQRSFIQTLVTERQVPADIRKAIDSPALTKGLASTVIDRLLSLPKAQAVPQDDPVTEPGAYRKDGVIYRVKKSRMSGSLYATRLDQTATGWSFVYEPGLIRRISPSDRMTLTEAMAFGVATGCCCICGALLTDPKSITRGIGPVCAKRV